MKNGTNLYHGAVTQFYTSCYKMTNQENIVNKIEKLIGLTSWINFTNVFFQLLMKTNKNEQSRVKPRKKFLKVLKGNLKGVNICASSVNSSWRCGFLNDTLRLHCYERHICNMPHLGLSSSTGATGRWRYLLQDKDHFGNGPHLVPGVLC